MAEQGVIPRRLKDIPTPACLACHYAKATKRPWRHKSQKQYKPPPSPTKPGEVVSVDQIVSPTPGLIAQMTGGLTTKRYKYATFFVDRFSPSPMPTSKRHPLWKKLWKPGKYLKAIQLPILSRFLIIMKIMESLGKII